jgi:hypothetical protein
MGGDNLEDMGALVTSLNDLLGQLDRHGQTSLAPGQPDLLSINGFSTWLSRIKFVTAATLLVTALLMLVWHFVVWRRQRNDETLDSFDRRFYNVRFRRRMQTAAIFGVLGVLILMRGRFLVWGFGSTIDSAYSGVVWVLSIWVLVLAAASRISSKRYFPSALARLRRRQHDLEKKLESVVAEPAADHGFAKA